MDLRLPGFGGKWLLILLLVLTVLDFLQFHVDSRIHLFISMKKATKIQIEGC